MKHFLYFTLLIFVTSCASKKPIVYETVTECDDTKAAMYIHDCMKDAKVDSSTPPRLHDFHEAECVKRARELYCKKVIREVKNK